MYLSMHYKFRFSYIVLPCWILEQIQPHMPLLNIIGRGKLKYRGNILRTGNSLEKVIMQGKVEGKRRRARWRRWLNEITEKLGLNLENTLKLATNRKEWRKAVYELTRSQHRLDGRWWRWCSHITNFINSRKNDLLIKKSLVCKGQVVQLGTILCIIESLLHLQYQLHWNHCYCIAYLDAPPFL